MSFFKSSDKSAAGSSFPRSSGPPIGVVESLIAKRIVESIGEPNEGSKKEDDDASSASGSTGKSEDTVVEEASNLTSHAEFFAGPSCDKILNTCFGPMEVDSTWPREVTTASGDIIYDCSQCPPVNPEYLTPTGSEDEGEDVGEDLKENKS